MVWEWQGNGNGKIKEMAMEYLYHWKEDVEGGFCTKLEI